MRPRPFALASIVALAATSARAEDPADFGRHNHFDVGLTAGGLSDQRSGAGAAGGLGLSLGGEARFYARRHGVLFAYTVVPTELSISGLGSGPALHLFDLVYSFVPSTWEQGSLSLELGPSVGVIGQTYGPGSPPQVDVPWHATVGGRAGVTIRAHFDSGFLFGIELGYRGGAPLVSGPSWEGTVFGLLSFGWEKSFRLRK